MAPRVAPRALLLLALLPALALAQAPGPSPGEALDLRPRHQAGERLEVEARLRMQLKLRLRLPQRDLDHTSEQTQVILRRYTDEVRRASAAGEAEEVRRSYQEAWEGTRLPGSTRIERAPAALRGRSLVIRRGEGGKVSAVAEGEGEVPAEALAEELLCERYEGVLPAEPVRPGQAWTIEGSRLAAILGPGLGGDKDGKLEARFVEVREEALDGLAAPPERLAILSLSVRSKARQGPEEDAPTLAAELTGELRFSLARRQLVAVDLSGTARLRQVRREDGMELTVTGEGPLEVHKRLWSPARPPAPGAGPLSRPVGGGR